MTAASNTRWPTLHPRNTEFEWQAPSPPYRRIDALQAQSWSKDGFFVLEDAFAADEIDALVEEIDAAEAETEAFLREQKNGRLFIARAGEITFTAHLVKRLARARAFTKSEIFRDLGHDLIGPDVRLYWDQAVYKKPGTEAPFPWHQDNGYTYIEPQQYLTCWVALTDADTDNGCPWVLPGLHRHGTLAHTLGPLGWVCVEDDRGEAVPAPVRKGGIVVFSSLTPHSTGPNQSDCVRKSYIVQLAPDGAKSFVGGADISNIRSVACDDPERQFPIMVGGEPA